MRLKLIFMTLLLVATVFGITASGQTCTGSLGAPVVNETFGAGKIYGVGPALDPALTTLKYVSDGCGGEDGEYTITTSMGSSCKGGTWKYIPHDHTGDANGYMMVINATIDPSVFFTYRVKGDQLCPSTNYEFAAFICNILRDLPSTQGYSEPNITFSIQKTDGTVLKTYNTGNIKADDLNAYFKKYGTFFTSPNDGSDVIVVMTNNGSGGNGNDLALDDITFSPCGPLIKTGFNVLGNVNAENSCAGDNLNFTLVSDQTGYDNPDYQWQRNKNDGNGWVNIAGAKNKNYSLTIPAAAVGEYDYRVGVLSSTTAGFEKCRIYSAPLVVNVFPNPAFSLSSTTAACIGHSLSLTANGGDSYLWTGPKNFTSTSANPVVTYSADPSDDGVYTVKVTQNNCPTFSTTTVTVSAAVTVQPMDDVAICAGGTTQLSVQSQNGNTFKWFPADGLDHDDIANPVASPLVTTKYTVYVSNSGCPEVAPQSTVTVKVNQLPIANAGKTIKMFEGDQTQLQGTVVGDNINVYWTPADYLNDPTSPRPVTSAPGDITYTLHVESLVGCGQSTSSVFVRVYKKLTVVTAFTPNGDGINDLWNIKNIDDYPKAYISVFTRYGQKVFESNGYGKPWDGNENGKKLPAGAYYYIIDLKDDDLPKQAGWVALIR